MGQFCNVVLVCDVFAFPRAQNILPLAEIIVPLDDFPEAEEDKSDHEYPEGNVEYKIAASIKNKGLNEE